MQAQAGRWRGPGAAFALSLAVHGALLGAGASLLGRRTGIADHGPVLAVELAAAPSAATATDAASPPAPASRTTSMAPTTAPAAPAAALDGDAAAAPIAVLAADSGDEAERRRREALATQGASGIAMPRHLQAAPVPASRAAAPATSGADAPAQRGFVELHVLDWLAQHRSYPRAARRAGLEGTVHVRFVIDPEGRIADATVERSSGARVLDRAALDLLGRASPVPGLAQFGLAQALELRLPIDYRLRRGARAG